MKNNRRTALIFCIGALVACSPLVFSLSIISETPTRDNKHHPSMLGLEINKPTSPAAMRIKAIKAGFKQAPSLSTESFSDISVTAHVWDWIAHDEIEGMESSITFSTIENQLTDNEPHVVGITQDYRFKSKSLCNMAAASADETMASQYDFTGDHAFFLNNSIHFISQGTCFEKGGKFQFFVRLRVDAQTLNDFKEKEDITPFKKILTSRTQ